MDKIHPAPREFSDKQLTDDPVLRYFHYAHLPAALQSASAPFCDLANMIVSTLPRNAERSVALRKLLEAKDAAVRANVGPDTVTARNEWPMASNTFEERLLAERAALIDKVEKLTAFLNSDAAGKLDASQADLLAEQFNHMCGYLDTLTRRCQSLGLIVTQIPAEDDELLIEEGRSEPREVGGHDVDRDGPVPFNS